MAAHSSTEIPDREVVRCGNKECPLYNKPQFKKEKCNHCRTHFGVLEMEPEQPVKVVAQPPTPPTPRSPQTPPKPRPRRLVVPKKQASKALSPEYCSRFGPTIRKLRELVGISVEELGDRSAGLLPDVVRAIEKGTRRPTMGLSQRLAAGLGISAQELRRAVKTGSTEPHPLP